MAIPAYYSMLHSGSHGPDAALVQTWLNGVRDTCSWYSELSVDGHFGKATENAVRELQLRSELTCDGKVGRATWEALYLKYTVQHGTAVPYPGIALRHGDAGATVKYVQQQLNTLGYTLHADGRFGTKTDEAVSSWQAKNELKADGIVGKDTWEKLF